MNWYSNGNTQDRNKYKTHCIVITIDRKKAYLLLYMSLYEPLSTILWNSVSYSIKRKQNSMKIWKSFFFSCKTKCTLVFYIPHKGTLSITELLPYLSITRLTIMLLHDVQKTCKSLVNHLWGHYKKLYWFLIDSENRILCTFFPNP